ncbi:hypothetical protein GCM10009609_11500 [Pseudonocardia aurantiaca]
MLTLLEEELMRRLCETAGLGLVRHTSSVIAATSGAVAIGELRVAAGVSSTHLAQRFKELIGVTPKRLARTYRVFAINPAGPIDWATSPVAQATSIRPTSATSSGRSPAHADPVRRSPAAVPARTSRPRAGRLAAAGRLIFLQERQLTTR